MRFTLGNPGLRIQVNANKSKRIRVMEKILNGIAVRCTDAREGCLNSARDGHDPCK
jgi:hypothetical protein